MHFTYQQVHVLIKTGDIAKEKVEAIVNAANSGLKGGGGVDGAIHRAGGLLIMEECQKIGGCPPGQAVITSAGNLPAKFVIHTVGPIYHSGQSREEELLGQAYQNSLALALKKGIKSIAFPSISTGAYGYPIKEAAGVALTTCLSYLDQHPGLIEIRFILFSHRDYEIYLQTLKNLFPHLYDQGIEEA